MKEDTMHRLSRVGENAELVMDIGPSGLELTSPNWPGLRLGPLSCSASLDGSELSGDASLNSRLGSSGYTITRSVKAISGSASVVSSELTCQTSEPVALNRVTLLEGPLVTGTKPSLVRVLCPGGNVASIRPMPAADSDHEECALTYWVAYNQQSRSAILIGYLTLDRWLGRITTRPAKDGVTISVGFEACDVQVEPGDRIKLEDVVLMAGPDPWKLLEQYADLVKERYDLRPLQESPVSWCSWYPYRFGVTEELLLKNAEVAEERLKPFGFRYLVVDCGWEKDYLPSTFEENDQFPHGMKWLSQKLAEKGFVLGAWEAPWAMSEFDPVVRERPEWFHKDESGKLLSVGPWFWEPHGDIYVLDLSNPDATDWLLKKMASLAERGIGYFKCDFLSIVHSDGLNRRYDPHVATGGSEAVRAACKRIREAVKAVNPEALMLRCDGFMVSGIGIFELLCACEDTGNTGYLDWDFQKRNFTALAAQLFKHRRWGILQPCCTCVGLPGTIEEARLRATAAFMSGGELNIGDDLTVLPEDRWEVLLSILPLHSHAAKPVDLFEPMAGEIPVVSSGQEDLAEKARPHESGAACVWHLHVKADWDEWDLVALFNFDPAFTLFRVPLASLGVSPNDTLVGYEFWSRQFLGPVPDTLGPKRDYIHDFTHPGDARRLIHRSDTETIEAQWFGPAVKLLAIRSAPEHPWVVGTSFHQSCGLELRKVTWDGDRSVLSGELHRPRGHRGEIILTGAPGLTPLASVEGRNVPVWPGASGSVVLSVEAVSEVTRWEVRWK